MNISETPFTSRVALYLKIANILRSRIVKGVWRAGDRMPNITALCAEFQVARITIRKAINLLSEEGLISSSRGRGTYVTADQINNPVREKMKSQLNSLGHNQAIHILEIGKPHRLPASMAGNEDVFDKYVCIRKLHSHDNIPYCLMDIYVARELFNLFPQDALPRKSVAGLVSRYSTEPVSRAKQTLTVGFADYGTSQILDCSMAAPIAEVDRFFFNAEDKLLSRGHYLYRGDLFLMETEHMGDPLSDLPSGWLPDVKNT